MKAFLCISCVIVIIVSFVGCGERTPTINNSNDKPTIPVTTSTFDDTTQILYKAQGDVNGDGYAELVTVSADMITDSIQANLYLNVHIANNMLVYSMGTWDKHVLKNGKLDLVDLNSDRADEIVLLAEITSNGGTLMKIFSVVDDTIQCLYDLNEQSVDIDVACEEGYQICISNEQVGFSCAIDIANQYSPELFDDDGKVKMIPNLFLLPIDFYEIINESNQVRLLCSRMVKLTNYIGRLNVVFEYQPDFCGLKVTEITFEPNEHI